MRRPNSLATMCAISGSTIEEGETLPSPICLSMLTTSEAFLDIAAASSRTGTGIAGIWGHREKVGDCVTRDKAPYPHQNIRTRVASR